MRELLKQVKDKSPIAYLNMNGFKMLYEMSADKAEIGMFLPYLDLVFRGRSEEEAFLQYLLNGYEEIGITVFNKEKARQVDPDGTVSVYPHVNEPSRIPLLLILSARNQKEAFFHFFTPYKSARTLAFSLNYYKVKHGFMQRVTSVWNCLMTSTLRLPS